MVSLRVFDESGQGDLKDLERAIDFATKEDIPILNYLLFDYDHWSWKNLANQFKHFKCTNWYDTIL